MEILLFGSSLLISLTSFLSLLSLLKIHLQFMEDYPLLFSQLIKYRDLIGFKKFLMMDLYVISCGVILKKDKLALLFHLEGQVIFSEMKFFRNFYIIMDSITWPELISYAHKDISYYSKMLCQQCGQLLTMYTEWETWHQWCR